MHTVSALIIRNKVISDFYFLKLYHFIFLYCFIFPVQICLICIICLFQSFLYLILYWLVMVSISILYF